MQGGGFTSGLIVLLLMLVIPGAAVAQSRHALVVGIDTYSDVAPLQKARNDARAIHAVLLDAGFASDLILDAGQIALLTAVNTFAGRINPGDEVVVFFAGHGVEIDGRNYLLPADVPQAMPGTEILVTARALALDTLTSLIEARGARVSLIIVDACRDSPFPRQGTRSLGASRGLGRVPAAPEGTFILFSAGVGQAALDRLSDDDPDPNSVFTRVLLPNITEPGLPIHEMARQVRTDVRQLARTVGHEQFPAVYDQFDGTFVFVPSVAPEPEPNIPALQTTGDPCVELLPLWQVISESVDTNALTVFSTSYADRCPTLSALAAGRLALVTTAPPQQSEVLPEPGPAEQISSPNSGEIVTVDAARPTLEPEVVEQVAAILQPALPRQAAPTSAQACTATERDVAVLFSSFAGDATFQTFLDRHPQCNLHAPYARSALSLRRSMVPLPGTEARSAREAQRIESELLPTPVLRRMVQSSLQDLGFDPGPVDGIFGPATRTAIREYMQFTARAEHDFITPAALRHLRIMHRVAPNSLDGRWSLTFARQNRGGDLQRLQQIYIVVSDGLIARSDVTQPARLRPLVVHALELMENGGFRFDVTSHYIHAPAGQLRAENARLRGALEVSARHLVRRTRSFDVGRYDDTWRAVVLVERMP
jgi:hypothetical protein